MSYFEFSQENICGYLFPFIIYFSLMYVISLILPIGLQSLKYLASGPLCKKPTNLCSIAMLLKVQHHLPMSWQCKFSAHPTTTESKFLRMGPSNFFFLKNATWFLSKLESENHCSEQDFRDLVLFPCINCLILWISKMGTLSSTSQNCWKD